MTTCSDCGAPMVADAHFCPSCGAGAGGTLACSACSATLAPGARFCASCGAAARASAASEPEAEAGFTPAPVAVGYRPSRTSGRSARPWILSVAGIATVAIAVVLFFVLFHKGSGGTVMAANRPPVGTASDEQLTLAEVGKPAYFTRGTLIDLTAHPARTRVHETWYYPTQRTAISFLDRGYTGSDDIDPLPAGVQLPAVHPDQVKDSMTVADVARLFGAQGTLVEQLTQLKTNDTEVYYFPTAAAVFVNGMLNYLETGPSQGTAVAPPRPVATPTPHAALPEPAPDVQPAAQARLTAGRQHGLFLAWAHRMVPAQQAGHSDQISAVAAAASGTGDALPTQLIDGIKRLKDLKDRQSAADSFASSVKLAQALDETRAAIDFLDKQRGALNDALTIGNNPDHTSVVTDPILSAQYRAAIDQSTSAEATLKQFLSDLKDAGSGVGANNLLGKAVGTLPGSWLFGNYVTDQVSPSPDTTPLQQELQRFRTALSGNSAVSLSDGAQQWVQSLTNSDWDLVPPGLRASVVTQLLRQKMDELRNGSQCAGLDLDGCFAIALNTIGKAIQDGKVGKDDTKLVRDLTSCWNQVKSLGQSALVTFRCDPSALVLPSSCPTVPPKTNKGADNKQLDWHGRALCEGAPAAADSWYVFLAKISGGSILVETQADIAQEQACNVAGGGLCRGDGTDPLVQYTIEQGPFLSEDEATAAYCKSLTNPVVAYPIQGGAKSKIYGGNYWVDTAPACPAPKAAGS